MLLSIGASACGYPVIKNIWIVKPQEAAPVKPRLDARQVRFQSGALKKRPSAPKVVSSRIIPYLEIHHYSEKLRNEEFSPNVNEPIDEIEAAALQEEQNEQIAAAPAASPEIESEEANYFSRREEEGAVSSLSDIEQEAPLSAPELEEPMIARSSMPAPRAADNETAPISLKVAQAFFNGENLHIKIHLGAKTSLDPRTITVGVRGLREGEVVEEYVQRVSDVFSSENLVQDTVLALRFVLKEPLLTEYQISGSWGVPVAEDKAVLPSFMDKSEKTGILEDEFGVEAGFADQGEKMGGKEARARLASPAPAEKLPEARQEALRESDLALEDLDIIDTVEDCPLEPCDIRYSVHAKLSNYSNHRIGFASLAVGLYWANFGQVPKVPPANSPLSPNEELIELNNLALSPGRSKRVRIRVDRAVPVVPGGSFVPHVRIIDFGR